MYIQKIKFTELNKFFSKEKFEDILSLEKIIISHSIKNKVISELIKINKDAILWTYNCFTTKELKSKIYHLNKVIFF